VSANELRPAPIVTDDNRFFWEAARDGHLVAQRCAECRRLRHPPRPMCPECLSLEFDVVELSGRGIVYSYSILHHPKSPRFEYPVIAALVDLEEHLRLVSNLVGDAARSPTIGAPVEVEFVPTEDGFAVPVFHESGR
jgi:uncharacterized protein